jgi:hypothetical protein
VSFHADFLSLLSELRSYRHFATFNNTSSAFRVPIIRDAETPTNSLSLLFATSSLARSISWPFNSRDPMSRDHLPHHHSYGLRDLRNSSELRTSRSPQPNFQLLSREMPICRSTNRVTLPVIPIDAPAFPDFEFLHTKFRPCSNTSMRNFPTQSFENFKGLSLLRFFSTPRVLLRTVLHTLLAENLQQLLGVEVI